MSYPLKCEKYSVAGLSGIIVVYLTLLWMIWNFTISLYLGKALKMGLPRLECWLTCLCWLGAESLWPQAGAETLDQTYIPQAHTFLKSLLVGFGVFHIAPGSQSWPQLTRSQPQLPSLKCSVIVFSWCCSVRIKWTSAYFVISRAIYEVSSWVWFLLSHYLGKMHINVNINYLPHCKFLCLSSVPAGFLGFFAAFHPSDLKNRGG